MDTSAVTNHIREFLAGCRHPVVIEDGEIAFDLSEARYSVSGEHDKTLLHLWSPERNIVRRVVDCECKGDELVLAVLRFGQNRPVKLTLREGCDARTPARESARAAYRTLLRRVWGASSRITSSCA